MGADFAAALHRNLAKAFRDFGSETVSHGSHVEKLCLIDDGVGRDHLNDFATNLIKGYLLGYTQDFALGHLHASRRCSVAIDKVRFDYDGRRWQGANYELPFIDNDYVLLTPKDILTKDEAWINRADFISRFHDIYPALPDQQLRDQVSAYFMSPLSEAPSDKERRAAAASTISSFPELLDHYIRRKEDSGPKAHRESSAKVRETEELFVRAIKSFVESHLHGTEFYQFGDSFNEALKRVRFLKDVIENKDGYRLFYVKGKPLKREADLHIMYRLTWCASSIDVNREVNNGRGPVDFKVSPQRCYGAS